MEIREILIANTRTQKRYKLNSAATTLGELKQELYDNEEVYVKIGDEWVPNEDPIDYSGMSFTEGISNTALLNDDSLLPHDIPFRGEVTNNLVILLTNTQKNIKSGTFRQDIYAKIQKLGLQEGIKDYFGKNYTQVSTDELSEYVEDHEPCGDSPEEKLCDSLLSSCHEATDNIKEEVMLSLYDHIKLLAKAGVLTYEQVDSLVDMLTELTDILKEYGEDEHVEVGNITNKDIDAMINSLV